MGSEPRVSDALAAVPGPEAAALAVDAHLRENLPVTRKMGCKILIPGADARALVHQAVQESVAHDVNQDHDQCQSIDPPSLLHPEIRASPWRAYPIRRRRKFVRGTGADLREVQSEIRVRSTRRWRGPLVDFDTGAHQHHHESPDGALSHGV